MSRDAPILSHKQRHRSSRIRSTSHSRGFESVRLSKVRKSRPRGAFPSRRPPCEVSPGARAESRDALIRLVDFGVLPAVTTKKRQRRSCRSRRASRQRARPETTHHRLDPAASCPWLSTCEPVALTRQELVSFFLQHHDWSIIASDSSFIIDHHLDAARLDQVHYLRNFFLSAGDVYGSDDGIAYDPAVLDLGAIPDEAELLRILEDDDVDLEQEEDPDVTLTDSPPSDLDSFLDSLQFPDQGYYLPHSDFGQAIEAADRLLAALGEGFDQALASAGPTFHCIEPDDNTLPSSKLPEEVSYWPHHEVEPHSWRQATLPSEQPTMAICRFFQQGNCKFGDRCRNEHPRDGGRSQSSNPFGSAQSSNRGGALSQQGLLDKYSINLETVRKDLTTEAPQWILSAYAPGRDAPEQLFGGSQREQSFEEMRLHYYAGKATGQEQQALALAQELWQNAQQQMQTAVQNLDQAGNFIVEAENKHPNRHDICREGTQGAPFGQFSVGRQSSAAASSNPFGAASTSASANPFGAPSQPAASSSPFGGGAPSTGGSAFGQPSTMGAKPNPFGTPSTFGQPAQATQGSAFGQPTQMGQQTSAFGQPSAMGAKPNPFGAPTQASQTQGSAFGQPSQMGSTAGAFGQPSRMGSTGGSAFGQASQMNSSGSAFGQPSQAGNTGASAFGQPSTMGSGGSAFGQPSQMGSQGSAFGQASQMGQQPSPFGQNTASTTAPANPFGSAASSNQPAASPFATAGSKASAPASNPFGQPSQPATTTASPFATTSSNTQSAAATSPFGAAPAQTAPKPSPFGAPSNQPSNASPFGQPAQAANPFGQPSQPSASNPFGAAPAASAGTTAELKNPYPEGSSKQHPKDYIKKDGSGTTVSFKGQPVTLAEPDKYVVRSMGGQTIRVWFPDGPPAYSTETEMPREQYDDKTLARWQAFEKTGNFEDGVMPELPPPRECTVWDF